MNRTSAITVTVATVILIFILTADIIVFSCGMPVFDNDIEMVFANLIAGMVSGALYVMAVILNAEV